MPRAAAWLTLIRNRHALVYKLLLFVFTISLIVYILPRQVKFKYEYNHLKGKPWNYEDLIAPFDFAIQKTQQEIEQERSEILKNNRPYFNLDTTVKERELKHYISLVTSSTDIKKGAIEHLLIAGKDILDSIYAKGIIEQDEVIEDKQAGFTVFVGSGSDAEEVDLKNIFTIQAAANYIAERAKKKGIDETGVSLIDDCLSQNLFYNKETSEKILNQALQSISDARGKIQKDEKVISKGEIVDNNKFQLLESLQHEYESQSGSTTGSFQIILGQTIVVGALVLILGLFLFYFRNDLFLNNGKVAFLLIMLLLIVFMALIPQHFDRIVIYALPFCILPIIIRTFFDTRTALFVHLITLLIISIFVPGGHTFLFIQLTTGIVAIYSIANMGTRSQFMISAGIIFISYSIVHFGLSITHESMQESILWKNYIPFMSSSVLTLTTYPLIFIFEKLFGFVSDVTLMELSDTNNKLLRELATRAPGTFQHSMQVASLSEEAIYKVGGNPLLVRTGALYHDIGKMEAPMFFIENQTSGATPHNGLSFEESAGIIINHVIKGIELAREHNIPEMVIDFIRTHHGTTKVEYFYRMQLKESGADEVDEEKFRYPGPIPYSKETAVLMMADAVEATSRSLKSYDSESISKMVDHIIDEKIRLNQFINADITFKDITTIKKIFKKKIMNIYHVRMEYPR